MSADIHTPFNDQLEEALENMIGPDPIPMKHVIVDGRIIPGLMVKRDGDRFTFNLDGRFGIEVPKEVAIPFAWFVANAIAVGAGYTHCGADEKRQSFAAKMFVIDGGLPA